MVSFEKELHVAMEAAELAGKRILEEYERFIAIPNASASITTEADRLSQELILQHLLKSFPNDALCAEEKTPTLLTASQSGSRIWIVDPIDGTRGFAKKNGEFSVMIGLVVDGMVALGVVLEPALWRVTFATKGQGCWVRNGKDSPNRCHVSDCRSINEATLIQSHSKPNLDSIPVQLLRPAKVIETYSAGVKLAFVARGESDIYVNTYSKFADWDICAGHILVEEAGGIVTELNGSTIRYSKPGYAQEGGLIASNGKFHQEAIQFLRTIDLSLLK
jgi:3'(2'), 5'-bisphosphate nucleotidase